MRDDGRRESIPMTASAPRRSVLARVNTRRPSTSPSRACVLAVVAALGVPGLAATRGATAQTSALGGQERGAEAPARGPALGGGDGGGGAPEGGARPGRRGGAGGLFRGGELIPAGPFPPIFNPGAPPRIVWRDVDEVRRLGADGPLRVRWFDADLD